MDSYHLPDRKEREIPAEQRRHVCIPLQPDGLGQEHTGLNLSS